MMNMRISPEKPIYLGILPFDTCELGDIGLVYLEIMALFIDSTLVAPLQYSTRTMEPTVKSVVGLGEVARTAIWDELKR